MVQSLQSTFSFRCITHIARRTIHAGIWTLLRDMLITILIIIIKIILVIIVIFFSVATRAAIAIQIITRVMNCGIVVWIIINIVIVIFAAHCHHSTISIRRIQIINYIIIYCIIIGIRI